MNRMRPFTTLGKWALGLTLAVTTTGCLAAAAAGAGGAIYLTDRGAESLVNASLDETYEAARETFSEMGIRETKNTTEGDKRELQGSINDLEIDVDIERKDETTRVEVTANKTRVTWDKDYARSILQKIVERAQ